MKKTLYLTAFIVLFNLSTILAQTYNITGYTTCLKDSTKVFLRNSDLFMPFDTTYVVNNTFNFQGPVEGCDKFFIRVKDLKGLKTDFLFVDNTAMKIDLRDRDFENAIITGGPMQNQRMELRKDTNFGYLNNIDKIDFIKKHPNYEYSAYLLMELKMNKQNEEIKLLYDGLDQDTKESEYGKIVDNYLNNAKDFKKGVEAVDFTLKNMNGVDISLSSFKGKYVYLDFWGSWCGSCRVKHPFYREMYNKYKDQGFEIVSVSLDKDENKWKKAVKKDNMNWTTLIDPSGIHGNVAITYKVFGVPLGYLIDRDGKIITRIITGQSLKRKLVEMFE